MLVLMAIERGTREASVAVRSEEEEEEEEEGEVLEGGARLPPQQQSKHECLSLLLTPSLSRQCPKRHFGIGPTSKRKRVESRQRRRLLELGLPA